MNNPFIYNNVDRKRKIIALVGNPNVGKSSVFNILTGQNQHTGNWTGKTVENARGRFKTKREEYIIVDTPGTYSLSPLSTEEKETRDFLLSGKVDLIVFVSDAELLERNLYLCLQLIKMGYPMVMCLNFMDEAKKQNIEIDIKRLSERLRMRVIPFSARKKEGIEELKRAIDDAAVPVPMKLSENKSPEELNKIASSIAKETVKREKKRKVNTIDKLLSSKIIGFPLMLLMLMIVFWLTISAANYPSRFLEELFSYLENLLSDFIMLFGAPKVFHDAVVFGIFRVLSAVVSVMLPPMAIFFPLFAVLEESGFLPRVAFNLDRPFAKCRACGKQALTMCMGFGCNAAGVMGCRIINSKRERLLAAITNCFVPCNGKFPAMIVIIALFFGGSVSSAIGLGLIVLIGVGFTFIATALLSKTLLKGEGSSYVMELPPIRKPDFLRVMIVSLKEKTLKLLLRAIKVAAPAGLIIWGLANVSINGESLLTIVSSALNPIGKLMGLDGTILLAFILGFPANEIVLPLAIMGYSGGSALMSATSGIGEVLMKNGWSETTAVCFLVFSLLHFPCSTTFLTLKKETGSIKWAFVSAVLPTVFGFALCILINFISKIFQ